MFLWFHTAVCIVSLLFHQQGKSQQILSVSGNSRFWTVLKSLGDDHGGTVADERKHSAGTLSLSYADKDMKMFQAFYDILP